jgi:hypothetical protein
MVRTATGNKHHQMEFVAETSFSGGSSGSTRSKAFRGAKRMSLEGMSRHSSKTRSSTASESASPPEEFNPERIEV